MAMDVFDLVAKLKLDTSEYEDGLGDAEGKASGFGKGLGSALGTAGKVAGVALTATTTAVTALGTQSVKAFAETEQLEGGIETLFGAGGKSLEEYAETAKVTAKDIENSPIDWEKYANTAWMENGGISELFSEMKYNMEDLGTSAEELEEYLHFEYDLDVEDAKAAIKSYQDALTDENVQAKYESAMAAQETVLENAKNAYKSAGMSANDYMNTVIGMAGALNKATGDTEESAKLADMAITDMSDNVNKLGTSMEMVQNAYTGFSRGNFTMLDNLALGYAGTKEGMQELLDAAQQISGVEYDISSYADIVQAIHVVQEETGIAGTTSKEAATTIQGSFGMLQAAWENLVAGFADPDADLGSLMDNLVVALVGDEEGGGLLNNVTPVIERTIEGIGKFLEQAAPIIAEQIPNIINDVAPSLLDAGANMLISLVEGLVQAFPSLASTLMEVITNIGNTIGETLPTLIPMIVEAMTGIWEALTNPDALSGLLEAAVSIIEGLVNGLIEALPILIEALPTIIQNIMTAIQENLPIILEALVTLVMSIVEQLPTIIMAIIEVLPTIIGSIVETLISLLPMIVQAGIQLFLGLMEAIPQAIPQIIAALPDLITSIIDALLGMQDQLIDAGVDLFVALVENLPEAIIQIVSMLPQIITAIVKGLVEAAPKIADAGVKLMKGLADGIKKGMMAPLKAVGDLGKKLIDKVKNIFSIHSPSRVFEEFGKLLDEGMAIGISENTDMVSQAMNAMTDATTPSFDDYGDEWGTSTSIINTGATVASGGSQMVTAILEVDKVQLGKVVFELNKSETQRIGVNLAQGGI